MSTGSDSAAPLLNAAAEETLADLFGHVADLADQAAETVTDAEVEAQLRRVIRSAVSALPDEVDPAGSSWPVDPRKAAAGEEERGIALPAGWPGQAGPAGSNLAGGRDRPTVLRLLLGVRLRRLREASGIPASAAARAIRSSEPKIRRIELGRTAATREITRLLTLYGVTSMPEREALLQLAGRAGEPAGWQRYEDLIPGWARAYLELEETAGSISTYDASILPDLLQTEDYARAVTKARGSAERDSDRLVGLTRSRQQRIACGGQKLLAIIDEHALRRPAASARVMAGQLRYLLEISDHPGFTLQVNPISATSYVALGSFRILRFPGLELPDLVYVELLTSALYLDRQLEVEVYADAMSRLDNQSASPGETRQIFRLLLAELG
jgi:transcriptional regulator with XRE-family HTH domain